MEGVVEGAVAHGAEDLLDLAAGFVLTAERDRSFAQQVKVVFSSHIRILSLWQDIRGDVEIPECGGAGAWVMVS